MSEPGKSRLTLDLDAMEREGAPEQFTATYQGVVYEFEDAMNIDWQELMASISGNMRQFFRLVLPAQAEQFLAAKLPTWKMRRLMESYQEHFGLTAPGEANGSAIS